MRTGADIVEAVLRLLDRGKTRRALRRAEGAVASFPQNADAHYALALVLTRLKRIADADLHFGRAAELEPNDYFLPYRLEPEAFEKLVEESLASLPEKFARHLENVEVAVEDVPSRKLLGDEGVEHDLLGIYQGDTIQTTEWGLPDRIVLFQRNLENISPDRETLAQEIRDTVLHEVGHHLGMEEEDLEEIEDGWNQEPDES